MVDEPRDRGRAGEEVVKMPGYESAGELRGGRARASKRTRQSG